MGHNCYPRELIPGDLGWRDENVIPKAPTDIVGTPKFLSMVPSSLDYLRIVSDDSVARRGVGGLWPNYIGAFPLGPAPREGDWLTRLRKLWRESSAVTAAKPEVAGAPIQIPEPPPLAEWLKGRKVLTVAQDGSGQFKTIQAALDALQPGQVVKVLDRGPYRESLRIEKPPEDTGLVSDAQTILEVAEWKPIKEPKEEKLRGHTVTDTSGFRLSGFEFPFPGKDVANGLYVERPSGFVLENCRIYCPGEKLERHALVLAQHWGEQLQPAFIRECVIDAGLVVVSETEVMKAAIERNLFIDRPLDVWGGGSIDILAIRHNVFASGANVVVAGVPKIARFDLSNNTLTSSDRVRIDQGIPKGIVSIRNNLRTQMGFLVLTGGAAERKNPWLM